MKHNRFFLITSMVQFASLVPLSWWAHKHPHPLIDIRATRVIQRPRSSFLKTAVLVLNMLISSATALNLIAIAVALGFWKRRLRLEALMTVGIPWTGTLVRTIIKGIVNRPRPQPELVQVKSRSQGKSFPSGDVSSSLYFWGWLSALTLLQMKGMPSWKKRLLMSFSGLCIILVGPARIYLGEHWSTDVLGGYLFGGGWLSLGLYIYQRMHKSYKDKRDAG